MNSDEIKEIVEKLKEQGKMLFIEGATEEQISEFETSKDFNLPSQFRKWLLFSDGGLFFLPAGIQLYGVAHKPTINVNENDRPDDSYVVIGALATGDPILCQKDSEQISIYNHEDGRIEDDEVYDDFSAFLNGLYELLGIGE